MVLTAAGVAIYVILGSSGNGLKDTGGMLASASSIAGLEVRRVIVNGNFNIGDDKIASQIAYAKGTPLAGFDVDEARQRLLGNSGIENVSVRKAFPDTVVVDVVESDPIAIWKSDGKINLISRSGRVVGVATADYSILPQVVGANANTNAAEFLSVMHRYPMLASLAQAYVRVGDRRWDIRLRNGMKILLPEKNWQAALAELYDLQARQEILDREILQIDMRLADRLVVKLPAALAKARRDTIRNSMRKVAEQGT